jgi:hypothetical protein
MTPQALEAQEFSQRFVPNVIEQPVFLNHAYSTAAAAADMVSAAAADRVAASWEKEKRKQAKPVEHPASS